jgi:hypothetical protein
MTNRYEIGNVVTVDVEFTDADTGDFVDPTTVTASVKDPLGVTTNYTVTPGQIVRDDLGKFSLDLEPNSRGIWTYKFIGTGANQGAKEGAFSIFGSHFE